MFLLYDFIFLLYATFYLPYLLLTRRGYKGYSMRFGLFSPEVKLQIKAKPNVWLHAVSVGEVVLIDGFIDRFKQSYPSYQLIVTVTTKTGYRLAQERLRTKAVVIPSPIDFSFIAGRFVSLIAPQMYIAVETEIWPNLYRKLYCQKIPIGIINGRISDSSFGRYKAVGFLLKMILNEVSIWCMQSQRDARRIMDLGAPSSRVAVTGNMKFDEDSLSLDPLLANLKSNKNELWWVAGSSHPGEEEIVLDVYDKVIQDNPQWRLVIAPRHIERVPQIMELIARRGLKAVKFSDITPPLAPPTRGGESKAVIVVDTVGQLWFVYSLASLVFVGKSLCIGGGHNVIEPAVYGKPIVIGPKFENFKDIVASFKESNAIVQVEDTHSFETAVRALCADESKRKALGVAALKAVAANQGATKRSLGYLAEFLK